MSLRSILVATDYSDCSRRALEAALAMAAPTQASVTVVHVWAAPYFGPEYGGDGAPLLDQQQHRSIFELIRERAVEDMKAFVASASVPAGVKLATRIESGEPVRILTRLAEAERPDLLVVGTHGRTGPGRWLLGSVAERVVRLSPCPVLTVPPEREHRS